MDGVKESTELDFKSKEVPEQIVSDESSIEITHLEPGNIFVNFISIGLIIIIFFTSRTHQLAEHVIQGL